MATVGLSLLKRHVFLTDIMDAVGEVGLIEVYETGTDFSWWRGALQILY